MLENLDRMPDDMGRVLDDMDAECVEFVGFDWMYAEFAHLMCMTFVSPFHIDQFYLFYQYWHLNIIYIPKHRSLGLSIESLALDQRPAYEKNIPFVFYKRQKDRSLLNTPY